MSRIRHIRLNDEQAREIIEIGQKANAFDGAMPESEEERIASATDLARFAYEARIKDHYSPRPVNQIIAIVQRYDHIYERGTDG